MSNPMQSATRRGFVGALAGAAGGAGLSSAPVWAQAESGPGANLPFYGAHQAGIVMDAQTDAYFVAFDLKTDKRADVAQLMKAWSAAAAALSLGQAPDALPENGYGAGADRFEMVGIGPARLSVTFGFGVGLFVKDGKDRFGLARQRPEAFVDMPRFPGDQLAPARSDGDLFVQICADNPQVVFHVARVLTQLAYGVADVRWVQSGFSSNYGKGETPRNLMGFKDGTGNPRTDDDAEMNAVVWVGEEGPAWMRGGSYVVVRRARMALEHWERTNVAVQEQTFGRAKASGAPLGKTREADAVDLDLHDAQGNPVVPEHSHVALTHRAALAGVRIVRRSYSYNDGANITAERWPPWKQGMEFDAGLVFVGFQRDVRKSFIPLFEMLSRYDMMNQFVTNTGGGHYACPTGVAPGDYVGRALLEG